MIWVAVALLLLAGVGIPLAFLFGVEVGRERQVQDDDRAELERWEGPLP